MSDHETPTGRPQSRAENKALVWAWQSLWNGDLEIANEIVAEDFVAHAAPLAGSGPDEIRGRDGLKEWISGIHAVLRDLNFMVDVGPFFDGDYFVVRWRARGTCDGGFPSAAQEAIGQDVTFTGTDTLRVEAGKLAEYWANADSLLFFQQLGVSAVPGR